MKLTTQRAIERGLLLAMAAIVLAGGRQAGAAELRFRRDCCPSSGLVCLGDVAEIVAGTRPEDAQLASIELFPTPAAGEKRIVAVREIRDRLALRGERLAKHTISGASRVTIYGAVHEAPRAAPAKLATTEAQRDQARSRVRSALLEYLASQAGATRAWDTNFELSDDQVRLLLETSARPTVQGGTQPWHGRQDFVVTLDTRTGPVRLSLPVDVQTPREIVVAARALARGTTLSAADLRLQVPATDMAPEGTYTRVEDVVGQETVRALGANEPLTRDQLRAPLLVRRREAVTVFARSPGIQVRTTGRALEDGALGAVISVESLLDRRTFFARVSGAQEVEVYARAVNAATAPTTGAEPSAGQSAEKPSQER